MPLTEETKQQVRQTHAPFIHAVVSAAQNPTLHKEIEGMLNHAEENGWAALVVAVRRILSGHHNEGVLVGLDDEDLVIVTCILDGIRNPATLPDVTNTADGSQAAPGLAQMIHAARQGDTQSLQALALMGEQMTRVGGDMARVASTFHALVQGDQDVDTLTQGMEIKGCNLLLAITEELGKFKTH
ncbi:MAG TPA: hypothetical protein ENI80_00125 [Acidiferrobacteraceae bacterium]|nr:hypothetical protein [Acidiferrobacteraceae bacterium]